MIAITKEIKINVYEAIFYPILTYDGESCVLTKDIKIQAAEMKYLREIKETE